MREIISFLIFILKRYILLVVKIPKRTTKRSTGNAGIDEYDVSIYNNILHDINVG